MKLLIEIIQSSRLFDEQWYKTKYDISGNSAEHYLLDGWRLGYNPSNFFITSDYLNMYPDVAEANLCPLLHYEVYGRQEGRRFFNRFKRITEGCDLGGRGLEIAPLANPICPKSKGFNIETLDHLDTEGLKEKYRNDDNINIDNIQPVDYVWNGEEYKDLIGKCDYYDYIVASHLIEHTTDLIGFFNQCTDILKEGGTLSLAVPNKLYTFDFFREKTGLREVIARHELYGDGSRHSADQIADYFSNIVSLNEGSVWDPSRFEWGQLFEYQSTKEKVFESMQSEEFLDVHAWVFTPASFRILVHDLWELGYISLREKTFYFAPDEKNEWEFYISLEKDTEKKTSREFDQSRRLFLQQYRLEEEKYFYHKLHQIEVEKMFAEKLAKFVVL